MPSAFSLLGSRNTVIKLDTTELDRLVKELPEMEDEIVRSTAFAAMGRMVAHAEASVDTGANMNSIHVKTIDFDGSGVAIAAAKAANPAAGIADFPKPTKHGIAHVGPAMEYSLYLEFGTHKMAAQPFVYPAMEGVEQELATFTKESFTRR